MDNEPDTTHSRRRPFLQPGYKKPDPWGTEEWRRGSHLCVCDICGKEYGKHPLESGPGYGSCGDEILDLMRTCDGRLIKP